MTARLIVALALAASGAPVLAGDGPPAAEASQDEVRVEVRVIAVVPAGEEAALVRVDQGTAAGLSPGDRITFLPLAGTPVPGTVRATEPREATVEVRRRADELAPGVVGELFVPGDRFESEDEREPRADGRPPIPWDEEGVPWADDVPLLAEVEPRTREERDPAWRGRVYATGDIIRDRDRVGREDRFGRLGLDARGSNLFGLGGVLHVDGEFNARDTDVNDGQGEQETLARLDRLSYSLGGGRDHARRIEVGRFLPSENPELGLLDGVEVGYRTPGGHRFGASAGFLPSFDRNRSTGDTLQVASWAMFAFDAEERLQLGGAVQKTWHEGEADRDLLLARMRWTPRGPWSATATAWFDLYRAEDTPKDEGVELTQFFGSLTRRFGAAGAVSVLASKNRYPVLLRGGLQELPDDILRRGRSRRTTLSGWTRITDLDRLTARADQWSDQDGNGVGGELGWQRTLGAGTFDRIELAGFSREGRYGDVIGLRAGTGGPALGGRWRAHVDVGQYEQADFTGELEDLLQNSLLLGWDGALGEDWFLSLTGSYRFGDEQDTIALGFLLQRRF